MPKKQSAAEKAGPQGSRNEGEGSRTGARHYNKDTREFVESGKVEKGAEKAREAVEGAEGTELKRAEKQGLKPARH